MVREGSEGLDAEEARLEIAGAEGPRTRVVDVRDWDEFAESHIPGALHVKDADPDSLKSALADEEAERWVIVCGDGSRSRDLAQELASDQMKVAYIEGGMAAWVKQDNSVQPPPE